MMAVAIKHKKSSVSDNAPGTGDIGYGEFAINYADGRLYYKNSSNAIKNFIDSDLVQTAITTTVDQAYLNSKNINADTLDGQHGSYYLDYNNFVNTPAGGSSWDSATTRTVFSVSGDLAYDSATGQFSVTTYKDADFDTRLGTKTTANLTEGSNLYYTDTRVTSHVDAAYVQARQDFAYASLTGAPSIPTLGNDYVDSGQVSSIITADVDAAFINALTIDADTLGGQNSAYHLNYNNFTNTPTIPSLGNDYVDSGQVSSIITADVDAAFINALTIDADTLGSQAGSYYLNYNNFTNTPTIPSLGNDYVDSGQVSSIITADVDAAFINALTIDADTLAGLASSYYLNYNNLSNKPTLPSLGNDFVDSAEGRKLISVTDAGGDGSLSYNNGTGALTYTGPSASDVRGHFSAGEGVSISSGVISIAQAVDSTEDVYFGSVTTTSNIIVGGNLTVNGTTTTLNTSTLDVEDLNITVAKDAADSAAANGAGLTVDGAGATLLYNHSGNRWDYNRSISINGNRVLTVGDEGAGNGLDADTLDGQQGSYYLNYNNFTNTPATDNIFKNFAVSGQSTVTADTNNDTLTLAEGSGVTLTTNAGTDTITISASSGAPTQPSPPASPSDGDFWWDDSAGDLYIYYVDSSSGQWVQASPSILADNAVTYAKMQDMTTARILGRNTAGSGDPEELTAATVRTMLNVEDGATNYSHPTHPGDDFSVDTGALTGAVVVSDIDINVTTDTSGHVTDANGSVSTRTLTLANLGYTGATDANNYSHPNHTGDVTSSGDGATTIANNAVTKAKMANDAVGSAELDDVTSLVIYNSGGSAVKTLYGAGS